MPAFIKEAAIIRFWRFVQPNDSGCLLWTGARDKKGYGRLAVERRPVLAHRFIYEFVVGAIPEGLVLDHLCRAPSCVNWEHLEAVTGAINTLRGAGNGYREKTHCKHGHVFDEENTSYFFKDGGLMRQCAACRKRRSQEFRERNPEYNREYWKQHKPNQCKGGNHE